MRIDRDDDMIYKDYLVFRSYVQLGNEDIVMDELGNAQNLDSALNSVLHFAKYSLAKKRGDRDLVFEVLEEAAAIRGNELSNIVMAIIYIKENDLDKAWQYVRNSTSLEGRALVVQIFLALNRLDLAQKEYNQMAKKDDNAVIVRLANAWICLHRCEDDSVESALICFQELMNKYGKSVSLLNSAALAYMQLGNNDAAEEALLQSLEKDQRSSETKINLIILYSNMKQWKKADSQYKQLRSGDPDNPWLSQISQMERQFDRSSIQFE